MCGIVGLFRSPGITLPEGTLRAMTDAVAHRGPDGSGIQTFALEANAPWRVGLGHRRLSIIDLSDAGLQPMSYRDHLWMVFNGEVYNYIELRKELEQLGQVFRSHSDTEVVLAAYDQWGADCFRRFRGMWGLVLVDLKRRVAVLSRDRLGIKPLYVARRGGLLAAVSEIKQLLEMPGSDLQADEAAVRRYIATGYEDSTRSFFADVQPIAAGTCRTLNLDTLELGQGEPYWFPQDVETTITDPREAAERFRDTLQESVRLHMRSDVPVGCALSGGLDSSAVAGCVVALENGAGPQGLLNTFSATFPGEAVDERPYIDQVLAHISASPHFVTPSVESFLADFDDMTWKHDEPVGSLSQYAGYCVARLTRQAGVPVTLNGQGGDEVLSGYWQCYFVHLRRLAQQFHFLRLGTQLGGALLPGGNPELVRQVPWMIKRYRARRKATGSGNGDGPVQQVAQMTARQWRVYEIRELTLPRLLKWDDRNFMAFSVEGRYPFLDHTLIELCLSMAPGVLYDRGWTKEPLRRGLVGMLPQSILRRRSKIGFEPPQDRWLSGPLVPLVNSVIQGNSPAWHFTDKNAARDLARRVRQSEGQSREDHQALLRIVLLDRWLRLFKLA
ncbi:MAG: asparagine synthase (glutamine-hydrolyzing) [Pirellulales bacterium]